jgi:integrase
MKKIRGTIHYFGAWARRVDGKLVRVEGDGWEEALALYKEQADDLHAGRTPRVKNDGLTMADLCNRFLTAKLRKKTTGEITSRTFAEYKEVTDLLVGRFGGKRLVDDLAADDFGELRAVMAERWGPVRLTNAITRAKGVFRFAVDNGLTDRAPRYGSEFRPPDRSVLRKHKAKQGEKLLTPEQLRKLLSAAGPQMRAMILLGVNCGFGNGDCGSLPLSAVKLESGWVDFPRPKTGVARRCPLWPETVEALRIVLVIRPEPKEKADADIVFLGPTGRRWVRDTERSRRDNIGYNFAALLKRCGLSREGLNFYVLRHVFRTVADGARDNTACDIVMGHTDGSMASHYRERVEDNRLRAVTEHVRAWLFGKSDKPDNNTPDSTEPALPATPVDPPMPPTPPTEGVKRGEHADARPVLRLYVG